MAFGSCALLSLLSGVGSVRIGRFAGEENIFVISSVLFGTPLRRIHVARTVVLFMGFLGLWRREMLFRLRRIALCKKDVFRDGYLICRQLGCCKIVVRFSRPAPGPAPTTALASASIAFAAPFTIASPPAPALALVLILRRHSFAPLPRNR